LLQDDPAFAERALEWSTKLRDIHIVDVHAGHGFVLVLRLRGSRILRSQPGDHRKTTLFFFPVLNNRRSSCV
jgi:hypothetical protein